MKKTTWFLIAAMLLSLLAGCGELFPAQTAAPTTQVVPTSTTEAPPEEDTVPPGYDHSALAATWVRTGTEAEGDVNTGGNCTVVITAADDGTYRITYTDQDFPESNYADKAVQILDQSLYEGCGNDRWMGTVDHVSQPNITHALTIRDNCMLIIQNSFSIDGMPMVSYEYFTRTP